MHMTFEPFATPPTTGERPRVSVIVPAYNQARYLGAAIDSVLAQSWPAIEVVVVDDGSTDDTPGVLDAYAADPRVTIVRQKNAGVGLARNRGFAASTGAFVCFLDADDLYHPEKIAAQVAQFARDPGLGLVYCDIVSVDENGQPANDYRVAGSRPVMSGDIFGSLLMGGYFPPHTVMLRRDVFAATGGFDAALGGHADLDLWLRITGAGVRAEFLPEPLASYRQHDAGMSRDQEHMRRTRRQALIRAARACPDRLAVALSDLQDVNGELHAANEWLRQQLDPLLADLDTSITWTTIDMLPLLPAARQTEGEPPCFWDVELNGELTRAVMLHPPASVTVAIPDRGRARVHAAVALHPDVWTRPEVGPCRFEIVVDGQVGALRVVDPADAAQRNWLEIEVEVPPSTSPHEITLRTEGIGGLDHRWALWSGLVYERSAL